MSDPPPDPTFPITIRRTGGVGGFDDTVVLQPDGFVSVDTRRLRGRVCTLDKALHVSLYAALRTIRLPVTGATATPLQPGDGSTGGAAGDGTGDESPARIRISLTDVHDRPIDLSDPSLGAVASTIEDLVQDVTVSSPGSATCVTPTMAAG